MRRRIFKEILLLRMIIITALCWTCLAVILLELIFLSFERSIPQEISESLKYYHFQSEFDASRTILLSLSLIQFALLSSAAVLLFAGEFGLHTIHRLLAEPVERARIWREKLTALFIVLLVFIGLDFLLFMRILFKIHFLTEMSQTLRKLAFVYYPLGIASAVAGGCFASLYIRKFYTSYIAAVLAPVGAVLLWQIIILPIQSLFTGAFSADHGAAQWIVDIGRTFSFTYFYAPLLLWSIVAYVMARRRFFNLEV